MEPGRTAVARLPGTNLYTGATLGTGAPINVNLSSREAVNFPNVLRVYMNFRQPDQRGVVYPVPTALNAAEGLHELLLDEPRGRVYISNSGFNRIEVFDIRRQRFTDPIEVGQLPHSMAMSLDRSTLYVGDTGGESITIVDLDARRPVGRVKFPPIARLGAQLSTRPLALGMAQSGLQFVMSNANNNAGTLWRLIGDEAVPRPGSNIISPNSATTQLAQPLQFSYAATPGGEYMVALAGNGTVYLYDALADAFVTSRVIQQNPIQSYYGPAAGAPGGAYYLINGLILSSSLSVIGGAERPSTTQVTQPGLPGQLPGQVTVSAGQRHIAAVYAMNESAYVRMTMPVRQTPTSTTQDDSRPTLELVDIRTGAATIAAVAPENPPLLATGQLRVATPARQLAVDSQGTAYVITLSGLSVIPLQRGGLLPRPSIAGGARGILNANTGSASFTPGAFVTVTGGNLANPAVAETVPLPAVMGGSCVTFNDVPLKLLQTSPDQITAQIPDDLRPGLYVAQVRSLANATQSEPLLITVQRPQ
jgi:DNA-binding beta-propeller fold protein YncE